MMMRTMIVMMGTMMLFILNVKYNWMSRDTNRSAVDGDVFDGDYDVVHIKC